MDSKATEIWTDLQHESFCSMHSTEGFTEEESLIALIKGTIQKFCQPNEKEHRNKPKFKSILYNTNEA